MAKHNRLAAICGLFTWALLQSLAPAQAQDKAPGPWQANWAIPPGFTLEVDSSGFTLPVSIALVPNPGVEPQDPAYYVTELGGRILVVRNDRKVEVFADNFFALNVDAQMPELAGVIGLTGLCLHPETGYLFATYVHDTGNGRFNGITRFSSKPGTFALAPTGSLDIHAPFELGDSSFTRFPFGHQAGQCQVINDTLYVGTGDGELTHRPRSDQSSFGKILHMQLDGAPVNGTSVENATVADYIFASGLRNPFGQTLVGSKLVIADNGPGVDRVLHVRQGRDYLYDGSDASIETNAMTVLSPAKGTAHITYSGSKPPANVPVPPESLLVVLSGVPEVFNEEERPEISIIEVEPETLHVKSRPRSLVRYTGKTLQVMSSIAMGDDGIYFAPVYAEDGTAGPANVYRLRKNTGEKYRNIIGQYRNPRAVLRDNGCRGCHSINGNGGNIGPSLNAADIRERNLARINSEAFENLLRQFNEQETDPALINARKRVLKSQGDARLNVWLREKIMQPTIDNQHSIMPLLDISRTEAQAVIRFIMKEPAKKPAPK